MAQSAEEFLGLESPNRLPEPLVLGGPLRDVGDSPDPVYGGLLPLPPEDQLTPKDTERLRADRQKYADTSTPRGQGPTMYNRETGQWEEVDPKYSDLGLGVPLGEPRSGGNDPRTEDNGGLFDAEKWHDYGADARPVSKPQRFASNEPGVPKGYKQTAEEFLGILKATTKGPQATPVTTYSNAGVDEKSDVWTDRGYTSTGKNLVPGVAAVNTDTHPLGTMFRDVDSGNVFIAADKHSNKDPNVVDIFVPPDKYQGASGTRNLEVIGAEDVPKDAKGMQELLARYKAPNTPQIPLAGDGTKIPVINAIDKNAPYMGRPRPATAIKKIVMHGDVNEDAEQLLQYGRQVDPQRGFDPGYHFYIARDGRILQGAPIERITNHTKGENADSIGIVVAGADEGKMPTRQQEIAAKALVSRLGQDLGIDPKNVVGHGELQPNRRDKREGGNIASDIRKNGYLEKADVPLEGLQSMPPKMKDYGIVQEGNIDLKTRNPVRNADGSVSTIRSMSFQDDDGMETLIPTVVNGRVVPPEQAIAHYQETGEHLGKFKTVAAANAYAESLHLSEQKRTEKQYVFGPKPQGMLKEGNIDLNNRPIIHNPDGSISSERSFSIQVDGKEVLIPKIVNGKELTIPQAIDHFKKTGEHMGMFKDAASADAYAERVHNRPIPGYQTGNGQVQEDFAPPGNRMDVLRQKVESETNRLRRKMQEEGIDPVPRAELARTEKAKPAHTAEEFLDLTPQGEEKPPISTAKVSLDLGLKRWIDAYTGREVRRAEKNVKAEDYIKGAVPTRAQSWWQNAINSLGRGATSEGGLMAAEGAYAMAEYLTKGTPAEKLFKPSAQQREAAGKMRDQVRDYLHVDTEFANSFVGMALQGFGQLAMIPLYGVPGVGEATSVTQLFQEARDDYKQTMERDGKPVDENVANAAALKYIIGAAPTEVLMDHLIIGKFAKAFRGQKVTLGQVGKTLGILGAAGGATEGMQQAWLNYIAKNDYDPKRELTQDTWNSFWVGLLVEGGAGAGAQVAGATLSKLKGEKPGEKDTRTAEEKQAAFETRTTKPEPPPAMPGGTTTAGPPPIPPTAPPEPPAGPSTPPAPAPAPAPAGKTLTPEVEKRATEIKSALANFYAVENLTDYQKGRIKQLQEEHKKLTGEYPSASEATTAEDQAAPAVPKPKEPVAPAGEVEAPVTEEEPTTYTQDNPPPFSTTETQEEAAYAPGNRGNIEWAAQQVNRKFPGIPKIEVVDTFDQIRNRFPEGNDHLAQEPAVYDQDLGRIVMIRDNMENVPAEALHEYVSRLALSQAAPVGGLNNMLGGPEKKVYQQALLRAFPRLSVADFGTAWGEQFGYSNMVEMAASRDKDLSNPSEVAELIQEHASNVASQPTHPEWFEQLTSDVQGILGTMGLNLNPHEAATVMEKSGPASEAYAAEQENKKDAAHAAMTSPYVADDMSGRQLYPPVNLAHLPEIRIVQMPELIKLVKSLMGNLPVLKKLRKAYGQAHGKGKGSIYLHPEIFKDYVVASKVIAHEFGHIIDYIASGHKAFKGLKGLAVKFPKMSATIKQELVDLSHWWKPWDEATAPAPYTAYRKSGVELFADGMSVFFNSPAELKKRAPMFWNALFDFFNAHPDIHDQIQALQALLHKPHMELLSLRSKELRQAGFKDAGELWIAAKERQRSIKETLSAWVSDIKDQVYWSAAPIERRQVALEKAGVKISPELDMRRMFEEHPLADNLINTWLGRIKNEVIDKLAEHDITQEDLGEHLMHNRIMVGAYFDKAAPEGNNPQTSRDALLRMRLEMGLDRWQILERYADRFHDYAFDVVKEAYTAGMLTREQFDIVQNNRGTYATFRPISYVEKRVGAGLYEATGFLEKPENPFFTTVLKMIAFRRGIQFHRTKDGTIKFLKTYYPSEVKKARLDKTGRPLQPEDPRSWGLLSVREEGKWKNYEVPADIARMFDKPKSVSELNGIIRFLHWTFKSGFYQTFIKYNPAFQLIRSPARDLEREYTNMPAGVSARKVAIEHLQAMPVAARRLKGQVDPIVMEMYENFAMATPHDTFARNIEKNDPLEKILQQYHVLPEPKKSIFRKNLLLKWIPAIGDGIIFAGQILEAAPKIASYKILTRDLGWHPKQAAMFVRNYIGVPNYLKKGSHAQAMGAVIPFWNVGLQGLNADLRLMAGHEQFAHGYEPPAYQKKSLAKRVAIRSAVWWFKFAAATGVFALLQSLARHGAFGDDLKDLYDGISDYTHTNYMVIPIGTTEGGDFGHKTMFLQIPQDELSRMVGGLLKKTIDMMAERIKGDPHDPFLSEVTQLFGFAGGQLPGYHPFFTITERWGAYMRGLNPYDEFRGRHIMTSDQYLAGGWDALKPMLSMTWDETGLTNFFRYHADNDSTTEAVVSNLPILGSILKVSDYGKLEKQKRDVSDPKEDAAQLRLHALPDNVYKTLHQYNTLRGLGKNRTQYQNTRFDQLKTWYKHIYKPTFESAKRAADMGEDPRPIMDAIEESTSAYE